MFRSDRDALAGKVDDLRAENERLRAQNEAMRHDLLERRAVAGPQQGNVYPLGESSLSEGERAALGAHWLRPGRVWVMVLLHLLTFGLSSFFRFNLMHDRLPKAQHDDPSAAKAIGFHLIPYFGIYWVFWNGLRLADRLNLQLRLHGMPATISRSAVIAAGVCSLVPYVNMLLAPLMWLFVAISMQRAVNALVAEQEREELGEGAEEAAAHQPRMRIPNVADLPLPEEVAAQAEEEAATEEMKRRRL